MCAVGDRSNKNRVSIAWPHALFRFTHSDIFLLPSWLHASSWYDCPKIGPKWLIACKPLGDRGVWWIWQPSNQQPQPGVQKVRQADATQSTIPTIVGNFYYRIACSGRPFAHSAALLFSIDTQYGYVNKLLLQLWILAHFVVSFSKTLGVGCKQVFHSRLVVAACLLLLLIK